MRKRFGIGLGVLLIDRISKYLVANLLEEGQSIPLIRGIVHLTYVRNTGAAFGILSGQRFFFIAVTLVAVMLLIIYARQVKGNGLLQVAFGLLLGGAVGNLIDRLVYVAVIDFIDFRIWPVFNFADMAIVIGVALFALDLVLEWKQSCYEV